MLGRVPMRDVRSLEDVIAVIESIGSTCVIIFDVDNTLVSQGAPLTEFGELLNAAIDRVEAHPNIDRVIPLTNGPQRDVSRLVSRGNKPWTTRRRLGLRENRAPVVVVGDQVLTDGLLAWRLRATFLHLVIDDEREAPRQAIMRRVGRLLIGMLFRKSE
jgi:predicted HAD superfamily phosphohydrolase YqeG